MNKFTRRLIILLLVLLTPSIISLIVNGVIKYDPNYIKYTIDTLIITCIVVGSISLIIWLVHEFFD